MAEKKITIRVYFIVYVVLMLLLGLTVFIAELDLGRLMLLATLGIASLKAALVLIYFMHLRISEPLTKFVAAAALLWLFLLIGLTMCDVVNRSQQAPPREAEEVSQIQHAEKWKRRVPEAESN